MINRVLIRIKVLQVLYSYVLTRSDKSLGAARKELAASLDKTYELYNYLLKLAIELTDMEEARLEENRHKYMPTPEELNPDLKFVQNKMIELLRTNEELGNYFLSHGVTWENDDIFKRMILEKILRSDVYREYMANDDNSLVEDSNVWRQIMKQVVLPSEDLHDVVESKSLYWTVEDVDVMGQFAVKTFARIGEGNDHAVMPMYKNEEDGKFGDRLFTTAVSQFDENNTLIDQQLQNGRWDKDRIALIDRLVLCVALSEIRAFDDIPVVVSINEYIELAKNFGMPQSGHFVNGVLDAAVKKLRSQGDVIKA